MAARLFLFVQASTLTEEEERESAEKQYAITRHCIPDKAKLSVRRGRKATDLQREDSRAAKEEHEYFL
jgi:hypothetical protein